jgi:DNA-binding HxlR family transcriptional regulator
VRSYSQYCGLAKALDVVGDRWTLLIVRELLIGESRYTDLLKGLPGIATNLLVTRLAEMEKAGLITRTDRPAPASTTVFRLTPRGEELRAVIQALGRWAGPLMTGRGKDEHVRTRWMALPAELYLQDLAPKGGPVAVQIDGDDESIVIESRDGSVRARSGQAESPDVTLTGSPELALGIMMGRVTAATAKRRGLKISGNTRVLDRLRRRE